MNREAETWPQFQQILEHPVWDGNLISKTDRDALAKAGLIHYDPHAQDPDPAMSHVPGAWVPSFGPEVRFELPRVPDEAIGLGRWGAAHRYWWGPFLIDTWPTGRIFAHVHAHEGKCCRFPVRINPGDWR